MSIIWGCVDFSGEALPQDQCGLMEAPFHQYKIDRYGTATGKNYHMGCGIQYVTPESEAENLPVIDADSGVCFTADCIIDNRKELIDVLCPGSNNIPDGELMLLAYKKWGYEMPKRVLGAYAYAVYDPRKNRLILGCDHVYNRSLFYLRRGRRVYFATLIKPLFAGAGEKPEVNDEWISVFLALTSLTVEADAEKTAYKDVKRMRASHYKVFDASGERAVEYWSPFGHEPLRLRNDGEYREYFRDIMNRVTRETLRSSGETGILLSSGLDSTTVAALSEPVLSEKNRKLYAYTYVPVEQHVSRYGKRIVTDEQEGVELTCGKYPGIIPHFLSVPEQNAIDGAHRLMPIMENPYKSTTNIAWIEEFVRVAANDGVRIMLTGQMGNATISAGNIMAYALHMLLRGKIVGAYAAASQFSSRLGYRKLKFAKTMIWELIPAPIKRAGIKDYWGASYVNHDFARSVGISDKDRRIEGNCGFLETYTFSNERKLIFNQAAMAQVGDAETKIYLKHGLVSRDITKDIRVFMFCLQAPVTCFVEPDGTTRKLIRNYMADIFPPELLDEARPKGYQSADWGDRLAPRWNTLWQELSRGLSVPQLQKYIDVGMVKESLERLRESPVIAGRSAGDREFSRLSGVYCTGVFLESLGRV